MKGADVIVLGAGLYGCVLALEMRRRGADVLLLDRERAILKRASYVNQGRVHRGYHYPRSVLTGLRSRVNYPRFLEDYAECIVPGGQSIYAVARAFSNVTATQFEIFCERIGAPLSPAPMSIGRLFDERMIEAAYLVEEREFDARLLASRLEADLRSGAVRFESGIEARCIRRSGKGLELEYRGPADEGTVAATRILNCTYSGMNKLIAASHADPLPLKHEVTEMLVVEVPPQLGPLGITVMCGPFFSLLPFAPEGAHLLSHVRYTPRTSWTEGPGKAHRDPDAELDRLRDTSSFVHMIQDAQRYVPLIGECRYRRSLFEVKTVLTASETDDSRPILIQESEKLPGLVNVIGSKIDNVYDALDSM
ncbi:MAG: amino acid oxidase [Planctomycetes bacterium]|nr:amino acid oxidase [Planctomycetota bacterium]